MDPTILPPPPVEEESSYLNTLGEYLQPAQAVLQTPGALMGAALQGYLGLQDLVNPNEQVGGAYRRALEQNASATLGRPYTMGDLPRSFSESIDIWRALPQVGDITVEAFSPGQPTSAIGNLAKFGFALIGNIFSDPLNVMAKPLGLVDAAGRGGLASAYYQMAKDKNVVAAAGKLLGSPLMAAAYAPEIVTGAWEGMKTGMDGVLTGDMDKVLGGFGQAGLTGTLGYLGARGIKGDVRRMGGLHTAMEAGRPVLDTPWRTSPERQRIYNQHLEAYGHLPSSQIDTAFKAFVDPIVETFAREHAGVLPEEIPSLQVRRGKPSDLPLSPADIQQPGEPYDRRKGLPKSEKLIPEGDDFNPRGEVPEGALPESPVLRQNVLLRAKELNQKLATISQNIREIKQKQDAIPEARRGPQGKTWGTAENAIKFFQGEREKVLAELRQIHKGDVNYLLQEKLPGEDFLGEIREMFSLEARAPLADTSILGIPMPPDFAADVFTTIERRGPFDTHAGFPNVQVADGVATPEPLFKRVAYYDGKGNLLAGGMIHRQPDSQNWVIGDIAKATKLPKDDPRYLQALKDHPEDLREMSTLGARVVRAKMHELGARSDPAMASPDARRAEEWYAANVRDAKGPVEAIIKKLMGLETDEDGTLYQAVAKREGPKGKFIPAENLIIAFENADFSTVVHEFMHAITPALHLMMHPRQFRRLVSWAGQEGGELSMKGKEKLARGVERYALEGKAPLPFLQPVFEQVRRLMIGVYKSDDVSGLVRINDSVRRAFSQMLGAPKIGHAVGGTALEKIVKNEDPQLVLKYQHGREAQMLGLLDDVLKKVFTETGEIAVPGRGTLHDRLQFLAEAGVTPEEVSDLLGGKLSPKEVADFTIGVSQLGSRLEDLSKIRQQQRKMERKFLEDAKKDPAFMAFWERWNSDRKIDDDELRGVLADRKLWNAAVRGQGAVSNFARAMIAGTTQVAVYNSLNALTHYGLFGLETTFRWAEAKIKGDTDEVIRQRETLRGWDKNLVWGFSNLIAELGDKVRAPFKLSNRGGATKAARDLIGLIDEFGNKELVKQLLHRGDADLPIHAAVERPRGLQGVVSLALDLNLMSDRFARLAVMGAYGHHLLARYGVENWRGLADVARANPQAQKDVARMIQYGSQLALRASGGLTAPKNSIGSELIRTFSKIPLAWTVMPFPRFMFGTFLPVVVESFPIVNMFSKRVQNSLQYPALLNELAARKVELKIMTSDLVLLQRKTSYLSADQLARYNSLVEKGTDVRTLKRMAALQYTTIQKLKLETRQMKLDGLYEPGQVRAHAIAGPFMIAAFMAMRMARGDDGTEYNQIQESDDTVVNIDQHLGPFGIYALIGDVLAHGLMGSKKYQAEDGFARFRPYFEALTSQRYGGTKLTDMFESDRVTWDNTLRGVQKMSGDVGRMMGTGAWPLDILRRTDEILNEESRKKRRFDAPLGESLPEAVGEGLVRGFMSEIPGLRNQLPVSYEAATGKPFERIAPVRSILPLAPNVSGTWDQFAGSLLAGNRERLNPVTQFLNRHRGLMSGSDIMPVRTEVPEYDEKVAKTFGKLVGSLVVPNMKLVESLPEEVGVDYFTAMMRRARTMAEFTANLETIGKGKLPSRIGRSAEARLQSKVIGKFPYPIPPPPPHQWMDYLMLPRAPETEPY